MLRHLLDGRVDVTGLSDEALAEAVARALAPEPSEEEQDARIRDRDPVDLLVPEWNYSDLGFFTRVDD